MTLTNSAPAQLADAAENMSMALSYAETAFAFLARLHGDKDHDGHLGFEAVCRLCGQGLSFVLQTEGDRVEDLVANLRKGSSMQGAVS